MVCHWVRGPFLKLRTARAPWLGRASRCAGAAEPSGSDKDARQQGGAASAHEGTARAPLRRGLTWAAWPSHPPSPHSTRSTRRRSAPATGSWQPRSSRCLRPRKPATAAGEQGLYLQTDRDAVDTGGVRHSVHEDVNRSGSGAKDRECVEAARVPGSGEVLRMRMCGATHWLPPRNLRLEPAATSKSEGTDCSATKYSPTDLRSGYFSSTCCEVPPQVVSGGNRGSAR